MKWTRTGSGDHELRDDAGRLIADVRRHSGGWTWRVGHVEMPARTAKAGRDAIEETLAEVVRQVEAMRGGAK